MVDDSDDDGDGDDGDDNDDDDNVVIEDRLVHVAVCVGRISIGCLLWGQPVLETDNDMIIFDLEFDVYLEVKMIKLFPNIKFLSSPQSCGRIPQLSWS